LKACQPQSVPRVAQSNEGCCVPELDNQEAHRPLHAPGRCAINPSAQFGYSVSIRSISNAPGPRSAARESRHIPGTKCEVRVTRTAKILRVRRNFPRFCRFLFWNESCGAPRPASKMRKTPWPVQFVSRICGRHILAPALAPCAVIIAGWNC